MSYIKRQIDNRMYGEFRRNQPIIFKKKEPVKKVIKQVPKKETSNWLL